MRPSKFSAAMAGENTEIPQAKRIEFRIGIHLGDIIIDDNDIFGGWRPILQRGSKASLCREAISISRCCSRSGP